MNVSNAGFLSLACFLKPLSYMVTETKRVVVFYEHCSCLFLVTVCSVLAVSCKYIPVFKPPWDGGLHQKGGNIHRLAWLGLAWLGLAIFFNTNHSIFDPLKAWYYYSSFFHLIALVCQSLFRARVTDIKGVGIPTGWTSSQIIKLTIIFTANHSTSLIDRFSIRSGYSTFSKKHGE